MNKNYLSFISMGTGSSYGYGETPAEAVSYMLKELSTWASYFNLSEIHLLSTIYDVSEYEGFVADHRGLFGQLPDDGEGEMRYTETPLEVYQYALFKTPKLGGKARRWSELNALRSAVKTHFYSTYNEFEEAEKRVETPS